MFVELCLESSELPYNLVSAADIHTARNHILETARDRSRAFDLLLLDGNLGTGPSNGQDARELSEYMRRLELPTKIIGLSAMAMHSYGIWVDKDLGKRRIPEIGAAIAELFPEYAA